MTRPWLLIAALFAFGLGIGIATPSFIWPTWTPPLGMCAPGSRGKICTLDAERLGAVVQAPADAEPVAICNDTKLSYDQSDACSDQGGVSLWFNPPGLPADAPTCPLDVRGLIVTLHGPLCLNATPTP